MSRRPPKNELEFGSDSFLDVLANIVGILIILIVIAGARVARAPIPSLLEVQSQRAAAQLATQPAPSPVLPPVIEVPAEPEEPEETLGPDEPAPEIADQLAALALAQSELEAHVQQAGARIETLQSARQTALQQAESAARALQAKANALQQGHFRVTSLQTEVQRHEATLSNLLAEGEQVQAAQGPAKEIRHRLTPISQTVVGDEIHLRLSGNRVSVVPLDELILRLKGQIERQKDWLMKFNRHQGRVGPIGGFTLNYVVERQSLSVLEEMRYGSGMFRVGVTGWQVVPEPDLEAETADQALAVGSQFFLTLKSAAPKSSLTFWVYPDSYALYRQLQAACHAEGFTVSARPLPEGVPIAGSPQGSRSAGQ